MSDGTTPDSDAGERRPFPWWVFTCIGIGLATWAATTNVRLANENITRTNQVIMQNNLRQQETLRLQQQQWQRTQQQQRGLQP